MAKEIVVNSGEVLLDDAFKCLSQDNLEGAVMACYRHARLKRDFVNAAVFHIELFPNGSEVHRSLFPELSKLSEKSQKFIFDFATQRYLEAHSCEVSFGTDGHLPPSDQKRVLSLPVAQLEAELTQLERAISDMTVPSGMNAFDTAAFADRFTRDKGFLRLRISAVQTIKTRIKARCLSYATTAELQYSLQAKANGLLDTVQTDVLNFFKARCPDVFEKLIKVSELSESSEGENAALLLTEVRRTIKSAADYFYPARTATALPENGSLRKLGEEQYLNRLQAFVAERFAGSTAKDLLSQELDHLVAFIRRLNDLASKGVHANVSSVEAKQSLVGLYFFLYNVSQRMLQMPE